MQNGIQMDTLSSHLCGEAASSWLALPFTVPQLGASPPVVWPGPFLFNIPVSAQMSPPGGGLSSQLYPKHHPLPWANLISFSAYTHVVFQIMYTGNTLKLEISVVNTFKDVCFLS